MQRYQNIMNKLVYFVLTSIIFLGCGSKNESAKDNLVKDTDTVITEDNHSDYSSTSDESVESAAKNGLPTLIDFSATWCGPCKMMKPIFNELEQTYDDRMNFVTIDVDENPELSRQYNVTAVPTFVFLDKEGKIVNVMTGAMEQSVLENQINRMIAE